MWLKPCLHFSNIANTRHQVAQVAFKNSAPFIKCVTNIDVTTILEIILKQQKIYGFTHKMKELI